MVKRNISVFFMCFIALLFMQSAKSAVVTNLYEATIPIQNQSDSDRQVLFKQGLIQVLEKISGESGIEKQSSVKQAIEKAEDFVEQFTYGEDTINIKYNAEQIDHLAYQLGHTVWGQRRPSVILWLALEKDNDRRLIGLETDPALQNFLMQTAQQKGLPLVLPLMDLEDVSTVTVTDVWGQFPSVLQQASERYGAQNILVGRVSHASVEGVDKWSGRWQILTQNQGPTWNVEGKTLEEVLTQGINLTTAHLMTQLGAKNKNIPSTQQVVGKPILIGIENIQSANDFEQAQQYLSAIAQVIDVNIHQVIGNFAIFEVTIQGENGRQMLEEAIRLPPHTQLSEVDLAYRWAPQIEQKAQP